MEHQRSFFIDPREQSKEPKRVSETEPLPKIEHQDSGEQEAQRATGQLEYQTGYEGPPGGPGYRQGLGEKIFPSRTRRRRTFSWPVLIVVAIILLALSGFMTARYDRPWSKGYHEHDLFDVPDNAKLVVNNTHGKVYVHTSNNHHILVTTVTHVPRDQSHQLISANSRMTDNRTVAVDVDAPQSDPHDEASQVDLNITVPETTNLALHATDGVVSVENVKGTIQVDTTHSNIELDSTEGQVSLTTDSGNIELNDAQLSGLSTLKAMHGDIEFAGSLDPYGSYDFETQNGSTDVTLPDSSAFRLSAITHDGTAVDNDFHSTSVGDGQQATITIRTSNGHIALHEDD